MFSIKFFLVDDVSGLNITGFELGGIEIILNEKKFLLTDSRYYFMVLLSISDLLSALVYHYKQSNFSYVSLSFADSSFQINLERVHKSKLKI